MSGFYENITVSAAVPNAAADAEAAKDAAIVARDQAVLAKDQAQVYKQDSYQNYSNSLHHALQSLQYKSQAEGFANDAEDYKNTALSARNAAQYAQQSAQGYRDEANTIVNSVSANVATVANMADKIDAVANNDFRINTVYTDLVATNYTATVAADLINQNRIGTVASNMLDVITVASNITNMATVAASLNSSNAISTVAGIGHTTLSTVASLRVDIQNVASNAQDITTVANSISTNNNITTVGTNIYSVNAVANSIQSIHDIWMRLGDISDVEEKLTEIDNVSDSIVNVDTVAGVISELQTVAGVSDEVANLSKSTGNMATLVSKLGQTTDLAGAVTDAQNSATSAASSASTASTHATTASGHASTAATHAANLGSVAYQDLTAIAESKAVTANDVFVYDTSKDSDGGAWRNRTQGTSWYNEPLNTSDRGATKKFPAVAVIVAQSNYFYIYDGDDPSMPLWFRLGAANYFAQDGYGFDIKSITAKDGKIFVGLYQDSNSEPGNYGGIIVYDFVADTSEKYAGMGSGSNRGVKDGVRETNWGGYQAFIQNENRLVNGWVNDIAITVLPNAPIDPDTGLPVPTIAVATDGGVSVIKDDGSVVSKSSYLSNYNHNICDNIGFDGEDIVFNVWNNTSYHSIARWDYELTTLKSVYSNYQYITPSNTVIKLPRGISYSGNGASGKDVVTSGDNTSLAYNRCLVNINETTGKPKESLVNVINSSYNTGWMNGDIKLATLMDTTAETINAPNLTTAGTFDSYGSNLITNGEFPNNADGWGLGNDFTWDSSGRVERTSGSTNSFFQQTIQITAGRAYRVRYDVTHTSGNNQSTFYSDYGAGARAIVQQYGSGSVEEYFIAHTTGDFAVKLYGIDDFRGYWDNVVIEELQGVTFKGLHTDGTTASIDPSTFSLANGQVTITSNSPNATIYLPVSGLTVGKTYEVTFDYVALIGGSNGIAYHQYGGNHIAPTASMNALAGTTVTNYFKAETTSGNISFGTYANFGQGFTIDNVSVTEVVADRSVNNNGLTIVGNVTKDAVATGAELVSYDLGSANDYLTASNFDFPEYDCSVMFWVGDSGSDRNVLFLGDPTTSNPANGVNIWLYGSRVKSYWGGQYVYGVNGELDGGRHFVCFVRKGDTVSLYVDGKYVKKNDVPITNAITDTDLAIGKGHYANGQGCTDLALLRISATAPTEEQIAKIYRDEKPLFQEGAKCTLYGDSDAVTALAYDEDTGILHAGTTGSGDSLRGRSDFKGLQRVDNTTYGVATALSASNGLVVEE
jgi:hypothetical protein